MGGLAVSRDVAVGGLAIAPHANDPGAVQEFSDQYLNRYPEWIGVSRWILFALPLVTLFILLRFRRDRDERTDSSTR